MKPLRRPAASQAVLPRTRSLRRMALAAMVGVLLVVAAVFVALVVAIEDLHREADQRHSYVQTLVTTNQLERSVVDLETGVRGFLLTRERRFLQPYSAALRDVPGELSSLRAQVSKDPEQSRLASSLAGAIGSYERAYAMPLVSSGRSLARAQLVAVTAQGKRLLDSIRSQFAGLVASEQKLAQGGTAATAASAREAIVIASVGFLLTVVALAALAGYLQRWILSPVRLVAEAAARMRRDERGVRVPEKGRGEVASLAASFNKMADALEERDRALRTTRDRLQGVLDHASAIIYIKDSQGRYLLVNRGFEDARDLKAENVLGHTEAAFSPPEVAAQIAEDDRAVIERGAPLSGEYTVPTPIGMRTYWSVKFPIPAPDGEEISIGGVSTDITEHKQALRAAMEASRLKSQFVANMSHEIRTPLSGVIGMTNLLRASDLKPVQREYVEALATSGEALMAVIGDILDFSKIEAGRLELDRTEFELRELVEESCLMLAERAHAKRLELSHWVDPDVPVVVRGDRNRLRQILLNLLSNAVKFTSEGEVVLKLSRAGGHEVRFEIADTGVGISQGQAQALFEPFAQADQSTTRRYGGTGLGLAIARELVKLMGGEISATAREAVGSLFWFTAELPAVASPGAARPRADFSGLRILVVDDNETNRTVLKEYLSAWGLTCETRERPELALEALESAIAEGRPYRLAVLDYHMPGMDGLELASAIRSRPTLAELPIVLLTSTPADSQAAEAAGVTLHLLKPPRQSELYDAIAQAISGVTPERGIEPGCGEKAHAPTATSPLVLLAEDNNVNQLVATTMLEQRGLRTEVAHNGLEAVRMSSVHDYAAIFMDCQMPELDGYEATKQIRAADSGRRVPIIAMTANSMPGDRERCLDAGMDDYLAKPIRPDELDEALERWLPERHRNASSSPPTAAGEGQEDAASGDLLDPEVVARLTDDFDLDKRQILLDTFEQALRERLVALEHGLARGDQQESDKLLHQLKGSSATVGASRLSAALQTLRHRLGADLREQVVDLTELQAIADHSISDLRARLLDSNDASQTAA